MHSRLSMVVCAIEINESNTHVEATRRLSGTGVRFPTAPFQIENTRPKLERVFLFIDVVQLLASEQIADFLEVVLLAGASRSWCRSGLLIFEALLGSGVRLHHEEYHKCHDQEVNHIAD